MDKKVSFIPNVLVVGDLMIDHYLWGKCERISPEAPVQVVDVEKETTVLGGAGNVINNLLALGAKVGVCSVVGDDEGGEYIQSQLGKKGVVKEGLITQKGRRTSKKSRVLATHQQIVRFDSESKEDISKEAQDDIILRVGIVLDFYDILLLSDYGKGVLTDDLTKKLIALAKKKNKPVLVDPKGSDYSKYKGATAITPNKKEATEATKLPIIDEESLKEVGFKLKNSLELEYTIITLSEDGMAIFGKEMTKIPTVAKEVYDVTGAGDTVLAALGYALAGKLKIEDAVSFANSAAAVVVGKLGSATATLEEISRYEHSLSKANAGDKIKNKDEIVKFLNKNKKVTVFTNGCFDILHIGHVKYLEIAKSFGDILIVGLNSDDSVKRLKGKDRPVNCQDDRAYILAGLEAVDFVVIFEEDTPYELIKALQPDILVKGGGYAGKEVVGSDIAKEVRLVNFIEGKSTSSVIERIKGEEKQ